MMRFRFVALVFFLFGELVLSKTPQEDKLLSSKQDAERKLRGNRIPEEEEDNALIAVQQPPMDWRRLGGWFSAVFGSAANIMSPILPSDIASTSLSNDANVVVAKGLYGCNSNAFGFNICLDLNVIKSDWRDAFVDAKERWEEVVTGDLPSRPGTGISKVDSRCDGYPATIDDVYICAVIEYRDGPSGVIGSASWRRARNENGSYTSYTGFMSFDSADVDRLIDQGKWENIIIHEMGHVLGIGTLWMNNGVYQNNIYTGTNAQREWNSVGCFGGNVPVEQDSPSGATPHAHWDEECMQDELMTGVTSGNMPLSRVTIGTLADMGYTVNYNEADPFSVNTANCNSYCSGSVAVDLLTPIFNSEIAGLLNSEIVAPTVVSPNSASTNSEASWLSDSLLRSVHDYARDEFKTMALSGNDRNLGGSNGDLVNTDSIMVIVEDDVGKIRSLTVSRSDVL